MRASNRHERRRGSSVSKWVSSSSTQPRLLSHPIFQCIRPHVQLCNGFQLVLLPLLHPKLDGKILVPPRLRYILALLDVRAPPNDMPQRLGVVMSLLGTSAVTMCAAHVLISIAISQIQKLPPIPNLRHHSRSSSATIIISGTITSASSSRYISNCTNRGVVRIGVTHVDVWAKIGTNEHKTVHKPMPHKQWMALIEGGNEASTKLG